MKVFAKAKKSTVVAAVLLLGFVSIFVPYRAYAANITADSLGISGSNASFVRNVVRGNNIYLHFTFSCDSINNVTAYTLMSAADNVTFHDDEVILKTYSASDGTGTPSTYASPLALSNIGTGSYSSTQFWIEGTCVLPAGLSSLRKSFEISAYLHWLDANGTDRVDSTIFETNAGGNVAPVGVYNGKYLTCLSVSATPVLYEPSTWWQGGKNGNTIRVDFSASTAAPANYDTLYWLSGTTVVQKITFGAVSAATLYAGRLTYDPTANTNLGGFTAVAADGDTTGATTFTFSEPALATRAALVNGSTYTVKLVHCESGKAPASTSYSSFVYDNTAVTPTLTYPSALYQSGRDDDTIRVRFTLPENAKANTVTLEFRTGGSTAQQIIFSHTTGSPTTYSGRLAYDPTGTGTFSVVPGSNDGGTTLLDINNETNTTGMVNGTTYTVRLYYTDVAGNISSNADFTSFVYDLTTVAPTLTSPASPTSVALANCTFQWTNAEPYSSLILYITDTTATPITHSFTFTNNSYLTTYAGTSKSVTLNLGNLTTTADYTYNHADGTSLAGPMTFNWKLTAIDSIGNTATSSSQRIIRTYVGDTLNASGTGLTGTVNASTTSAPVLRLTCNAATGTVTLTQLAVDFSTSAVVSGHITEVQLYYSSNLYSYATFSVAGCTQLGSGQVWTGTTNNFAGFSRSFTTTPAYLYVTISTSANALVTDQVVARVLTAGSFTFQSGNDVASGTFPISSGTTVLPVELNLFSATSRNGMAYLHWVTESEFNNAGFDVLRRVAGQGDFQPVVTHTDNPVLRSQSLNGTSATALSYDFIDNTVQPGMTYEYRLRQVDLDGIERVLANTVSVTIAELPHEYSLQPNYPNPFNSSTNMQFNVPYPSKVTLIVYDLNGREVTRLVDGQMEAGSHSVMWNGRTSSGARVASGAYFVKLTSGKNNATRKILLLQ